MEDLRRYKRKRECLQMLLLELERQRELHYEQFKRYRKIDKNFVVGEAILSGITIGSIISGFVFMPIFIISAISSGSGFIVGVVHKAVDSNEKKGKFLATYMSLDGLVRDLQSDMVRNGFTADELENLYANYNDRLTLCLATSIL